MITGPEVVTQRKALGWSRATLAAKSGLTEGKIWRIENKGVMSDDEMTAVEAAFADEPSNVPLSPVRTSENTQTALSTGTDTTEQRLTVLSLEEVSAVELPTFACGHTATDHGEDDLCPRHPRNEGWRLHSNSELRTFKRCRRKWWLGWFRGLKPKTDSPIGALAVGQRIHRVLRVYYEPGTQVNPLDALELFITRDWTEVTRQHTAQGLEVPLELRKKFASEADLERAMIEGYLQWLAETGEDSELEVIAPETYLEVDVTDKLIPLDKPTKLIGKLDVRTRRRRDGVRRFLDHKTVGDFRQATRVLALDEQMLHYHLLEWLSTNGEEYCDAALYNMLRKVKRTATAKPPFYQRVTVTHNVHELKSYEARVLSTVEDVRLAETSLLNGDSHARWAYPNPTRDCAWDCPFFTVCGMFDDGSRVEDMLDQYYQRGDVLKYYMDTLGVRTSEGEVA